MIYQVFALKNRNLKREFFLLLFKNSVCLEEMFSMSKRNDQDPHQNEIDSKHCIKY